MCDLRYHREFLCLLPFVFISTVSDCERVCSVYENIKNEANYAQTSIWKQFPSITLELCSFELDEKPITAVPSEGMSHSPRSQDKQQSMSDSKHDEKVFDKNLQWTHTFKASILWALVFTYVWEYAHSQTIQRLHVRIAWVNLCRFKSLEASVLFHKIIAEILSHRNSTTFLYAGPYAAPHAVVNIAIHSC